MESIIYLDYNATTPLDKEVYSTMLPYLKNNFGNPSSSYHIGRINKEAVQTARIQVARMINASPDEIIFTGSATESNNIALIGAALANKHKGNHIITSAIEHPSVLEVCKYLESAGFELSYIPVDSKGVVNPEDLENSVRLSTVLITIMHANNEVGSIQPIKEISNIAGKNGIIFHTDASQSLGKIDTNVVELGVDMLTVAGHKLYAPKGIGALYIKNGIKIKNLMHGAGQEKGLRPGTENVPYIVALGKACEIAKRDLSINSATMLYTKERLYSGLKKRLGDKVKINGEFTKTLPNTLSVSFEGVESHTLVSILGDKLCISTGSACHTDSINISPVLKAMQVEPLTAAGTVRISTGKHTTTEEADKATGYIVQVVNQLT